MIAFHLVLDFLQAAFGIKLTFLKYFLKKKPQQQFVFTELEGEVISS
jgi:hypothetical protein